MRTSIPKIIRLPSGDRSAMADFLRYHVFVYVFDGDADRWIALLRERHDSESENDIRFARWLRVRIRRDPGLLDRIRIAVERTPIWRAKR